MRKHNKMFLTIAVAAATLGAAPTVQAQQLILGGGLGGVLNERRELPTTVDDLSHKLAFVALRAPFLPLEVRATGLWPDDPVNQDARAYIVSGVLSLPIGPVTPYAQAGWGDYNAGDPAREKWSAGIGARLSLGTLGIFAEATRYNRLNTDLITAGLTISTGK
jgi:hypothetical protein